MPVEKLPEPVVIVRQRRRDAPPYIESNAINDNYQVTTPEDQIYQWLDIEKFFSEREENNDETIHVLFSHGFTYHVGVSGLICAGQNKSERKYHTDEFTAVVVAVSDKYQVLRNMKER